MLSKRSWTAVAVVGLLAAGVLLLRATIPAPNGVIYGCYNKSRGTLRVIDNAVTACNANEAQLTWNQTGPQGPIGPIGPQGATGPQGLAGAQGPTGTARTSGTKPRLCYGLRRDKWEPSHIVATLNVPAGSYFIDSMSESIAQLNTCFLRYSRPLIRRSAAPADARFRGQSTRPIC